MIKKNVLLSIMVFCFGQVSLAKMGNTATTCADDMVDRSSYENCSIMRDLLAGFEDIIADFHLTFDEARSACNLSNEYQSTKGAKELTQSIKVVLQNLVVEAKKEDLDQNHEIIYSKDLRISIANAALNLCAILVPAVKKYKKALKNEKFNLKNSDKIIAVAALTWATDIIKNITPEIEQLEATNF